MTEPRRPSRSRRLMSSLLREAGIGAGVTSVETLGIGSAGLGARGNRDEDGTHARVVLDDGASLIYREYASTTSMANDYLAKETRVFGLLAQCGLPAPRVLASVAGSPRGGGDPAAMLLSDAGGAPLEDLFRAVAKPQRAKLWSTVGTTLRHLHDIDVAEASFLGRPIYQRPWTRFVPYFAKSLRGVKTARPDLAHAVDDLLALRRRLASYLDARPRSVCFNGGYYLPGMLLERERTGWRCASWLSLGYYVSVSDPDRDVVSIALSHREWTGDDVPASFYRAYGARPDPVSAIVYEAALQLGRGAAYQRGVRRAGWGPPPHSTAVRALDDLPATVDRLRSLLPGA